MHKPCIELRHDARFVFMMRTEMMMIIMPPNLLKQTHWCESEIASPHSSDIIMLKVIIITNKFGTNVTNAKKSLKHLHLRWVYCEEVRSCDFLMFELHHVHGQFDFYQPYSNLSSVPFSHWNFAWLKSAVLETKYQQFKAIKQIFFYIFSHIIIIIIIILLSHLYRTKALANCVRLRRKS